MSIKNRAFTPLFLFLLVYIFFRAGLFSGLNNFFEGLLFSKKAVSEDILILEIDDFSINKIGQWPWKRSVYGDVFEYLNEAKIKVLAFDVIMPEESRYGASDDIYLRNKLESLNYPIVFPIEAIDLDINYQEGVINSNNLLPVTDNILKTKDLKFGHVNLITDRDSVVRKFPTEIIDINNGGVYRSLSLEALNIAGFKNAGENLEKIETIVYSGPNKTIKRIPFWRVYEKNIDLSVFENKIIFVGSTAPNLHDEKPTPFDRGTQMSGVEIHAQIANMIINDYRLRPLNEIIYLFWIFLIIAFPVIIFSYLKSIKSAIILSFLFWFLNIIVVIILFSRGVLANFVYVNLSWFLSFLVSFLSRYFSLDKERREMKNAFSKYVSKDVLEEILNDPSKVKLGGEEREVTVFFSDVRGFTTLSEGMTPSQLTNFLNRYLSKMTDIILEKNGVVDKYIGDAIMAFWGAPVDNKKHALSAINSSLLMIDALDDFNNENIKIGDPKIDIGIGLNTGKVTVGNMGSGARFDYTVMGDTVNLASRLEGQTKNYGVKIIISEAVKNELSSEDIKQGRIYTREIDKIKVKGKNEPVVIFEVVPRNKIGFIDSIIEDFDALREEYYKGEWAKGLQLADSILKKEFDGPTSVLKERCLHFIKESPKDWRGVYEMKSK